MKEEETKEPVKKPTKEIHKAPMVLWPARVAFLHKAIMISGRTESSITPEKVPGIKQMGWTQSGAFLIEDKEGRSHLLPSAAVADSILE